LGERPILVAVRLLTNETPVSAGVSRLVEGVAYDLRHLPDAFAHARRSLRIARQNLFLSGAPAPQATRQLALVGGADDKEQASGGCCDHY